MNTPLYLKSTFLSLLVLIPIQTATADSSENDRTLSPYFFVNTEEDEGVESLPLRETNVEVDVAGVIADVRVTQVYENRGNVPIEAIYVFPGSTRAAVYAMTMTIGERIRIAKIKERQAARAAYTKAKKQGKSASLLEQHRPNVFQMNVANIMPGDVIKVELSYTELLIPTDGVYEFVYPTVVGPRYSNQQKSTAPASEHWIENPYLFSGEKPTYSFGINLNLLAGLPLHDVTCTSHEVDVHYESETQASISLKDSEQLGGNRDYTVKYRLQGNQIQSGLLLYEGDDENFFLMMMQPPKRVTLDQIPPREYIYIVDVSGSMHGFPLQTSKRLLSDLIGSLRPTDTFNVILFAGNSSVFAPQSVPANRANISRALGLLGRQRGGGGTELLPALKRALNLPHDENTSRTIVVVTDGYVSVETQAFDLIRNNLDNANLFAFGIGSSVNRYLIEGMARAGFGEPFIVTKPDEAAAEAEKLRKYIQTPVLTNIDVQYENFDVYDVEPVTIPDVLAERPVIVFGKWRGNPHGTVTISGFHGQNEHIQTLSAGEFLAQPENKALRYLWARNKIATLGDYNTLRQTDQRIEEITQLGLEYNLLTKYTSFVAIDDVVRNPGGAQQTVKQPLPLPKGVSNLAVGGGVPTVPEPETYLMLGLSFALLLWIAYRRRMFPSALAMKYSGPA